MRIHILSDLHLEFAPYIPREVAADVVILAGDIDTGVRGVQWARERLASVPVLYVPGNHEYYDNAMPDLLDRLREEADGSNVRILDNDVASIGGVTFIGATLWTDFNYYGHAATAMTYAQVHMADYRRIKVGPNYRRLRPLDTASMHIRTIHWLQAILAETREPAVVITHHAPSARSIAPRFLGDPLNPAFVSNLDDLVAASRARLWVHGHVHTAFDYMIGSTRVICNPRGYPDERNTGFESALVVDVG